MNVRAKFLCKSWRAAADFRDGEAIHEILLEPVISGSEENEKFFRWTPGGQVVLQVVNATAAEAFVVGKEYYVDFSPAE